MNLGDAHNTRFWYVFLVFSKVFDDYPHHFYTGVARDQHSPAKTGTIVFSFFRHVYVDVTEPK